jgi:hypothetical protein
MLKNGEKLRVGIKIMALIQTTIANKQILGVTKPIIGKALQTIGAIRLTAGTIRLTAGTIKLTTGATSKIIGITLRYRYLRTFLQRIILMKNQKFLQ